MRGGSCRDLPVAISFGLDPGQSCHRTPYTCAVSGLVSSASIGIPEDACTIEGLSLPWAPRVSGSTFQRSGGRALSHRSFPCAWGCVSPVVSHSISAPPRCLTLPRPPGRAARVGLYRSLGRAACVGCYPSTPTAPPACHCCALLAAQAAPAAATLPTLSAPHSPPPLRVTL